MGWHADSHLALEFLTSDTTGFCKDSRRESRESCRRESYHAEAAVEKAVADKATAERAATARAAAEKAAEAEIGQQWVRNWTRIQRSSF
jgi:hypothetical protein